jgi:tyrosyl-tRNA synthetase
MRDILDFRLPILDWRQNPKSKIQNLKYAIAALLLIASTAFAEDSALVKAAKASGGPNKKSTTKVITNDDVKKSAGKKTPTKPGVAAASTPVAKSEIDTFEDGKKVRAASVKRVAEAQTNVAKLEKELAAIEQNYYESNDPDARDKVIAKKFAAKKQELDAARKVLVIAKQ